MRFAGIGRFVAHAGVALIARSAAVRRRSAVAHAAGAGLPVVAEQPVITGAAFVCRLRIAGVADLVAHADVALIACAAAIRTGPAVAHAGRTGFTRGAKQIVVAAEPFVGGLRFACVGRLVANTYVALIARAATVGGRSAAACAGSTSFARIAEQTVIAT